MSETLISDSTPHNVADLGMRVRSLERKLNKVTKERDIESERATHYRDKWQSAEDRIKRLEEAIEGTIKWIVDLANSGDSGFWNPEEQSVIIAARAALNKEAKP